MTPYGAMPPNTSSDRLKTIAGIIKVLAVVASGCWIIFQYLTFNRQANQLTLKQQDLATQQASFTLQSQQAAQSAAMKQTELAVQQAALSLDIQRTQRTMRDKELVYDVETKRLASDKAKIDLQILAAQRSLRDQELSIAFRRRS